MDLLRQIRQVGHFIKSDNSMNKTSYLTEHLLDERDVYFPSKFSAYFTNVTTYFKAVARNRAAIGRLHHCSVSRRLGIYWKQPCRTVR